MAVPMLAALHRKGVGTKLAPSRGGQKCSQTFSPSPPPTSARDFFFDGLSSLLEPDKGEDSTPFSLQPSPPVSALSYSPKCAIKRLPPIHHQK